MRVVRIYHAGRDGAHRARDRALVTAGVDLRLIVPRSWPGPDDATDSEPFEVVELDVVRPGDVNRHRYTSRSELARAIWSFRPDVVDVHEEPVSLVARQVLSVIADLPVVMYTAQNLDKRWPPPFRGYERSALARVQAFYPCSRQAAAVLHAKGYNGLLRPLPLGIDSQVHFPGEQDLAAPIVLGFVGRFVPEKGLLDAIEVLAAMARGTRLVAVGAGPELDSGRARAASLGLARAVEWVPWVSAAELGALYRRMHVVLIPSRATTTWVEQFGRVITEAGANGAVPVGYDSGSIAEVIGGAGLVVPEGDVAALRRRVQEMIRDQALWAQLRENGLTAAERIRWTAVAQGQKAVYVRAVASLAPTGPAPRRTPSTWGMPAANALSGRPLASPILRRSGGAHRVADAIDRLRVGRRSVRGDCTGK